MFERKPRYESPYRRSPPTFAICAEESASYFVEHRLLRVDSMSSGRTILKSASGMALATVASRALGMIRDILFASILGGGYTMTAWVISFTIPNLFRRLLGEGALGTVVVPMVSHSLEKDASRKSAARDFSTLFAILGLLLSFLCVCAWGGCLIASFFAETKQARLIVAILPLVMPYAVFVCLSGIAGSALNAVKRFFLPASTALLLNVCIITALLPFRSEPGAPLAILRALSLAVLLAGIIQMLLMAFFLYRQRLLAFPRISRVFSSAPERSFLIETWRLAVPGFIAAGALQISFLIDRLLAYCLGDYAVPALFYSDRIVFLPIGVFAVSMGGVLLPNMSELAAKNDSAAMGENLRFGIRQLFFLCVPAAVFILICRGDVVRLLFMRGAFDLNAFDATCQALFFYSAGIPFFAILKVVLSGFHSRKDMRTPLRISLICLAVNLVLNLILMWPLRQGGIALATVLSALLNNILLLTILRRELRGFKPERIAADFARIALSCLPAVAAVLFSAAFVNSWTAGLDPRIPKGAGVVPLALIFGISYLAVSVLINRSELREWTASLLRGRSR